MAGQQGLGEYLALPNSLMFLCILVIERSQHLATLGIYDVVNSLLCAI